MPPVARLFPWRPGVPPGKEISVWQFWSAWMKSKHACRDARQGDRKEPSPTRRKEEHARNRDGRCRRRIRLESVGLQRERLWQRQQREPSCSHAAERKHVG